jgi:ERCC4-type nuclease
MSKLLLIDTREKPKAIQSIIKTLDEARIPHESTKLLFGDYMDYNRPSIVIDRKQNIAELAKNCTREHDRFRAELERAKAANARLIILVEQNRYKDRDKWIHVETIEDIMLWSSPHTTIRGEKVFRVLRAWMSKYDIDVQFCDKRQTGRRILEIIYGENRNS